MIKFCDKKRYAAVKYVYYYTTLTRILCAFVNLRRECTEVISITSPAGPNSDYPKKVMDSSPPPKPPVTLIEEGIAKMVL